MPSTSRDARRRGDEMKVERQAFLKALAAVDIGLSSRDIVEQSSCYVFRNGKAWTFNDEVACSVDLPDVFEKMECAVPSAPLKSLLTKFDEELVDVSVEGGELLVKGKRRRAGVRMHEEILLPVSEVGGPGPEGWKKLPEGFTEAIDTVQGCAGKDESQFVLTCIHIHPAGIEASDNAQAIRYKIKTGLKTPVLVKRDELRRTVGLGVTEWGQSKSWIHFRNPNGLVVSCRKWEETFPDMGPLLEVEGTKAKMPKGMEDAVSRAEVFVDSKMDVSGLTVGLQNGKLTMRGEGPEGWYEERQKSAYKGKPIEFRIAPRLLVEVCKRTDSCTIGDEKLKVVGDKFVYISCLAMDESDAGGEE